MVLAAGLDWSGREGREWGFVRTELKSSATVMVCWARDMVGGGGQGLVLWWN